MKIGVPGEFHEDRWQRTAEDSERCMIPRTREAGGAHRIQVIAWRRGLLTGLRHGHHDHKCSRAIPAWRRGLLTDLRHGNPAHRYLRAIPTWRRGLHLPGKRAICPAKGSSCPSSQAILPGKRAIPPTKRAIPPIRRVHPAHQKGHFVHQESQFVHRDGHFVSIFMQKAAYSGMASDLTYS